MIDKFRGKYSFLGNMYTCDIVYEGIKYRSAEAAYQSAKTLDMESRKEFSMMTPVLAKQIGKTIRMRNDWYSIKDIVMEEILRDKFTRNTDLKIALLKTGSEELIERNNYKDRYWGVYDGQGQNKLGIILMNIRKDLSKVKKNIWI